MLTYSTLIIIAGMFAEVLTVFKTISEVILVFQTDDFIFFFPFSERSSGWCLYCCPLWFGSFLSKSVTRKVLLSRKVS